MNDPLAESGWKALVTRFKVRDNGLQQALSAYNKLDEDDHAERLKAVAKVNQLAEELQRNRNISDNNVLDNYLDDVQDAADAEQRELSKAKLTAAKAEAEAKKQEAEEDKYEVKLNASFQKLRSSQGLSYEFIVCDSQPQCAVILAPAITAQHKQQLTRLTDGGKRFLKPGSCHFENGKFVFAMERPPSGLARKLQASIMHYTGRKLPILVGIETADAEADA
jgi:hypothetical protein